MSFQDIAGHERQKKILQLLAVKKRLPNSLLFTGPDGIGKRLVAETVAGFVLCMDDQKYETGDTCNHCISCRTLANNSHPDINIISPDGGKIKIDQIRAVQLDAYQSPLGNEKKFFIIDSAESMSVQAANCLLKVLEEPPESTVFILISSMLYSMLPTIISRCQRFSFNLSIDEVNRYLLSISRSYSVADAKRFARLSSGSIAVALALGDAGRPDAGFSIDIIETAVGVVSGDAVSTLEGVYNIAARYGAAAETFNSFLFWMQTAIRDIAVFRETDSRELLTIDSDSLLASRFDTRQLCIMYDKLESCREKMVYNVNKQLVIEELLTQFCML